MTPWARFCMLGMRIETALYVSILGLLAVLLLGCAGNNQTRRSSVNIETDSVVVPGPPPVPDQGINTQPTEVEISDVQPFDLSFSANRFTVDWTEDDIEVVVQYEVGDETHTNRYGLTKGEALDIMPQLDSSRVRGKPKGNGASDTTSERPLPNIEPITPDTVVRAQVRGKPEPKEVEEEGFFEKVWDVFGWIGLAAVVAGIGSLAFSLRNLIPIWP